MKPFQIYLIFILITTFIIACDSVKDKPGEIPVAIPEQPVPLKKTAYILPVRYADWEIGKPENVNTILSIYKAWDSNETYNVAGYFADTLYMRLPNEKDEIVIPNSGINEFMGAGRKDFRETHNYVISAVSLYDSESKQEWVMTTLYNKWIEKNGKRDSLLLHENWLIENGKVKTLLSFSKKPTKAFLKKNEAAAK